MGPIRQPRGDFDVKRLGYVDYNGNSPATVWTTTYQPFGFESGVQSSVKTPNFRKLRRSQLPINPYSYASRRVIANPATYVDYKFGLGRNPSRVWINQRLMPDEGVIQSLCSYPDLAPLNQLNTRIRLQVKNQDFSAAVALGEFAETAKFLEGRVGQIVRFLNTEASVSLRTGKRAKPMIRERGTGKWIRNPRYPVLSWPDVPKLMSNAWLEYSYAFIPLLSDIHGSMQTLAEAPYAMNRTTTRAKMEVREDLNGSYQAGALPWKSTGYKTAKRQIGIQFSIRNPLLHSFSKLGLTNPLSLGWELTRLSFVVDWFLPIGNALDSLDATLGVDFVGGFQSTKQTVHANLSANIHNDALMVEGHAMVIREQFNRVVLTDFPAAVLPRPQLPKYFGQAASGIALLHQILRK